MPRRTDISSILIIGAALFGTQLMACASNQPNPAELSLDEALRTCRVAFEDFHWTHDIDGTIFLRASEEAGVRLGSNRIACVEEWAAAQDDHIFLRAHGVPPGRDLILAKAIGCGLVPERDLNWSLASGRGPRAILVNRGATFDQGHCLIRWAELTGAPVDVANRTSE